MRCCQGAFDDAELRVHGGYINLGMKDLCTPPGMDEERVWAQGFVIGASSSGLANEANVFLVPRIYHSISLLQVLLIPFVEYKHSTPSIRNQPRFASSAHIGQHGNDDVRAASLR